jgi:hypothetical protein
MVGMTVDGRDGVMVDETVDEMVDEMVDKLDESMDLRWVE